MARAGIAAKNVGPDLEHSTPRGSYHHRCYQAYTHRKTLQALKTATSRSSGTGASSPQTSAADGTNAGVDSAAVGAASSCSVGSAGDIAPARRTTQSMTVKTDVTACLFCQQKGWKHRGSRGKQNEGLSQCLTFQAAETMRGAATIREDERVLIQVQAGPDAIATEIKYHKLCYSTYTDRRVLQSLEEAGVAEEDSVAGGARSKFQEAFVVLADEVEAEILSRVGDAKAIKLSHLRKCYIGLLEEAGVHSDYRAACLKLRLQRKFGERIKFIPGSSITDPEVVVSADILRDVLLQAAYAASGDAVGLGGERSDGSSDVDILEESYPPINTDEECCQQLFNAAMFLRGVILSTENTVTPVPQASDLSSEHIDAPVPLFNFLVWLLAGDGGGSATISIEN